MILDTIKSRQEKDDVIRIVKTKRLKINYSKPLNATFMCLTITKHIAFSTWIRPYYISFDSGNLSLGIDFHYRRKNIDHKGINIILRLLFFEIEIECTDNRHLEDYKNKEGNA